MHRVLWRVMPVVVGVLMLCSVAVRAEENGGAKSEIEEKAMTALKRMATFLSQAKQFSFTADTGFDVVQDWGQKIEFGETRVFAVDRPNRVRADATKRDGSISGLVFDGKELAVFNKDENVYATVAKPGSLDDAIVYFVADLDMRLPLAEMLSSRLPQILEERIFAARYVEQSTIAGVPCDHVALRGERADLQVWIAQGDKPLPQRLVITYTRAEGKPQFSAQFREWNFSPTFSDELFILKPAESAIKIAIVPPARIADAAETKGEQQ